MKARGFADSGPSGLLLRCLSDGREPSAVSREPATDWNEVVEVAVREHLAPLLFRRLKESDARAGVPADAWKRLRRAYFTSGDRNTRLYRELQTVLQRLCDSRVKVVVLKGAFLAEAVYGDLALRPMCDTDLLVPRAELPRAQAILLDLGYGPREREDIELLCRENTELAPFVREDSYVELHWGIEDPASSLRDKIRVDTAGLWARARSATIAGVQVLALSPEDLLLHLCLHASREHGLECGLRPFCDIAETIRYYGSQLNWPQFVDRAREWDAARYAGLTLHLAKSLLAVPVPESVLGQLVPGGLDPRLLKQATECVLAEKPYERDDNWAILPFPIS